MSARAWELDVDALERERILRGWTQRELSRKAHVDQGTLSDLLALRRRPTFGTIQAICTSLNLTLAEVIAFPRDSGQVVLQSVSNSDRPDAALPAPAKAC